MRAKTKRELSTATGWPRAILLTLLLSLPSLTHCARRSPRPEPAKSAGRIAFAANLKGNWDLFIVNADGTGLTQLTDTPLDERQTAISPDGKRLAYSTSDGALWVMSLETKAADVLSLPAGRYGYPTWLGDGSGLVYTSYKFVPGSEDADFFAYSFADGRERPFMTQTGPQDYPALSPDGGTLAYVTSQATVVPGFGSTITQQLWLASLRDGSPRQLAVGSAGETRPAWSPDGRRIAFSSAREGSPDIWTVSPDGRELVRLTEAAGAETSPAWSPDAREMAYVSTVEGRKRLMLLDLDTRTSRPLSPFGAEGADVNDPSWR